VFVKTVNKIEARVVNLFTITVKFPFLDLKGVERYYSRLQAAAIPY